jgi:hypothetical protein
VVALPPRLDLGEQGAIVELLEGSGDAAPFGEERLDLPRPAAVLEARPGVLELTVPGLGLHRREAMSLCEGREGLGRAGPDRRERGSPGFLRLVSRRR